MKQPALAQILFDYLSKYITLGDDEKLALIDLNIFKHIRKGTILLKEGQFSDEGYFVIKGCIRTYYTIEGEEKTTAFYTEAESLNPICVVNKKASTYFVACVEDCILVVANSAMEGVIFEKFPRFEKLCRILSEELLSKHSAAFDAFKTSSPEQRYLDLLTHRADLVQRVPQHQLASYLGITPQSLSRLRGRLTSAKK